MKRFRDCGCDDRDSGTYEQDDTPSPLLCESCAEMPCCWVARFGCLISAPGSQLTDAAGNAYLRVLCAFEDPCRFVSLVNVIGDLCVAPPQAELLDTPHGPYSFAKCFGRGDNYSPWKACTWQDRFATDTLPTFETGWALDLTSLTGVQLVNETAGITYNAVGTWDCTGPNTMALSGGRGDYPTLPATICVAPMSDTVDGGALDVTYQDGYANVGRPAAVANLVNPPKLCDEAVMTVEHNCGDDLLPCGYTADDRLACCDDCCDKPVSLTFSCTSGDDPATLTGTATVSERTPQQAADGQVYEFFSDVTIDGGTHNVGTVLYCSGGAWKSDLYCDEVYEQTITIPTECCPLRGTTEWTWSCVDCSVCLTLGSGVDCEPPPPPVETDCCPSDPIPSTLHYTLTSADCPDADGVTGTLEYTDNIASLAFCSLSGAGWEGTLSLGDCSGTITIKCRNDNTWAGCYDTGGGGPNAGLSFGTQVCEPFELSGTFYTGLPADCCSGEASNTIYITITA